MNLRLRDVLRRLREHRDRAARKRELRRWLAEESWPSLPPEARRKAPSQEEQDELLGYGEQGF